MLLTSLLCRTLRICMRVFRELASRPDQAFLRGSSVSRSDQLRTGSVYGLVKWNPVHWFGVGVRPELVRRNVFLGCGTTTCTYDVRSQARLSIGTEFGWVPGLALTGAAGAAVLVLVAAFAYD